MRGDNSRLFKVLINCTVSLHLYLVVQPKNKHYGLTFFSFSEVNEKYL